MPRQARVKSKTGIYHIVLRGINKQRVFEKDADKEKFIEILSYYKEKSKYEIYGYCLMDNHIHLLMYETNEDISMIMKRIGVTYVNWYNKKYERSGHLFQDRYKSEAVEDDRYILTVLRYIHQNPVKAGIVERNEDYKWSSYNDYIKGKGIVQSKFILEFFSEKEEASIKRFIEFMNDKSKDECLEIEDKRKISEQEAKDIILKYFKAETVNEIQGLDRATRNNIIRQIKGSKALSTRQIANIVGISQSMIAKI